MLLLFVQRLFCSFHTEDRCTQLDICRFWSKSINRHKNHVCVQKRTPCVCILLSITKFTFLSCTLCHELPKGLQGKWFLCFLITRLPKGPSPDSDSCSLQPPSILSHRALFPESEGDRHPDPSPELHQPNCLLG